MKFVKLLLIGLLAINSVLTTEETKFRLKKSHHKKGKTFLQKNRQSPPSAAPASSTGGSLNSLDGGEASNAQVVNQYSDLAKKTNILDMVPDQDPSVIDLKLGPGPVYYKGWIKYFKYDADENQQQRPTTFFKNTEFYQQSRKYPNADVTQKEDGMYKYIKNEMFFYVVLNYDSVNIMASRIQKLVHTYDTISIDLITPQVEDRTYHGGITDFGNFSEGFCFRVDTSQTILTQLPKGDVPLKSWIICTETAAEKGNFMTALRKIKVKHQRDQGIIINNSVPPVEPQVGDLIRGVTPNLKQDKEGNLGVTFNATENKITDGYWITLQDWTQCSLKCGGGVSTLHRMCVPPKSGGKPCDGPAILTKPCNVQPCPQVKQLKEIKQKQNQGFNKPVVKIMPFSDRPQRYTKCVIKESDMMYTKLFQENYQYVDNVQLPVRVVMNNKTISIFGSSDDYNSVMATFDLQATDISPAKNHPNCFILNQGAITETNKLQAELCPFGLDKSEETYQAWMYDFNLFKYQCKTERETVDLDAADAKALNDKYKKKVANAKLDIVEDRENLLKDKLAKQEEKNINVQVIKTNQMAMQAVQKEMTLEDMVKKEEEEREAEAEKEILQKLDEEKEKQDCLVKRIKEKELEDQYNIKIQEAAQEMKKIKDQAEKQLLIKRSMLKSDILKMRKKAERRKAQLEAQLQGVRIQMSKDMGKIYKDGDINKCKEALQNQQNRDTYCGVNYPDDYVRFTDCKSDDDFCYFCCETEFGDMHMDKRQQCYGTLCNPQKQPDASGKWIWVVDANGALANEAIKPPTFN